MDGRRGYPRVDNGVRGASTFKEPPTLGWMERDRIRALELNMHGELGREVSTVKPKGLSIVDLDATEFKEVAVKRVSNGITAAKALSRYAARLAPFAQAFMLGVELGDWLFDNSWPQQQTSPYSIPGGPTGFYTVSIPDDWVRKYTDTDTYHLWSYPPFAYTGLDDTYTAPTQSVYFGLPAGHNYDRAEAQAFSISQQGPVEAYYNIMAFRERAETFDTPTGNAVLVDISGRWQPGEGVSTPAEWVPEVSADRLVMPEPKVDPRVPYHAIPFQGLWSSPFTTRGNSVESAVQRLPAAASASRPGPTHSVELRPDGSGSSTTTTPTKTGYSQPAPRGTKERKFVLRKGGAAGRIFGTVTEIGDFVDCLFSAIPLKQRLRDGVTKRMPKNAKKDRRNPTGVKKFQDVGLYNKGLYVAKHFETIDIKKALNCIVINEIQDRGIGLANQMANTVTKNPYWVSPRGSGMIAPKF